MPEWSKGLILSQIKVKARLKFHELQVKAELRKTLMCASTRGIETHCVHFDPKPKGRDILRPSGLSVENQGHIPATRPNAPCMHMYS
jgi:hypothetical protein